MTTDNKFGIALVSRTMLKRMLIGYAIGLLIILSFILRANPDAVAQWGDYWMIQPLVITPLAGAAGGFCFHFLDFNYGGNGGMAKLLSHILGVIIFVIGMWMGIILGLHGTMWN